MAYEIERKFLVNIDNWRVPAAAPSFIRQAYLARNNLMSLRIRIRDNVRATVTIKSAAAEIRRLEFEYDIPLADAAALLDLRYGGILEKLRYRVPHQGLTWEIDVFQGENKGLVIAEIELLHEDQVFDKPDWLGLEITLDPRYSNVRLAEMPFRKWPDVL
jgi:adenylate cyclase